VCHQWAAISDAPLSNLHITLGRQRDLARSVDSEINPVSTRLIGGAGPTTFAVTEPDLPINTVVLDTLLPGIAIGRNMADLYMADDGSSFPSHARYSDQMKSTW
jgi:hypothetical protein